MLLKKLWRTMGLYKAQFISMVIMIALGIGVFVGFNMEWVSIENNMSRFFTETGYADYRIVSEKGFTNTDLEKIKNISGVTQAGRYLSVTAEVLNSGGDTVALTVTENEKVSFFKLIKGEAYNQNSQDGIWLSEKYANANNILVGNRLSLSYNGITLNGTVKGLVKAGEQMICVRDESQLMPDYNSHGFAYISPAMYQAATGADYYPQINVISKLEKANFTQKADLALNNTALILTKDESLSYAQAKGEEEEGQTMALILPTLFLAIALLTMVTTMHRLTAKEKTQIGTLKALGFKNSRISRHYTAYAFFIGLVGILLGILLGYGVAYYIMNPNGMMGTYLDMPYWSLNIPLFCYLVLAGILALMTVIGYLSVRQMLAGTAADALRPYTPNRVKALLVEKGRLFHRLTFGTRWNMRDIMRHKSRTAMSLLGIVGCMVIIVASLGMRDTMDAFLKLYYNDAMQYNAKIFLSQTVTNPQAEQIIERYHGDWSASVSVQAEQKTVDLEIYSAKNNLVKFPAVKKGYLNLQNNGAYVCMRLADEFNLKPGDSLEVSPYGTNQKYTLKIAGVMRSVSENMVITPAYAKELGLPYTVNAVYTKTEKNNIAANSGIKSVQSRQKIMDSFETFTAMMDSMIYILVLGALLLGVVVLYNLGVMSYTERYREMATLKVIGFQNKKIGCLLIGQNMWLTVLGVILGLPLAVLVLDYLLKALAGEFEMRLAIGPRTYIFSILLTFGMSLLVGLMVARKNKKIDMVEALKGAE